MTKTKNATPKRGAKKTASNKADQPTGFWLVKQYLGMSVTQTFKTWTVMECLISVIGLLGVLLLSLIF